MNAPGNRTPPARYVLPSWLDVGSGAEREHLLALADISAQLEHIAELTEALREATARPARPTPNPADLASLYSWALTTTYADAVGGTKHATIADRAASLAAKAHAAWLALEEAGAAREGTP